MRLYVRLKSAAATLFEGFFQRPTLELSQESRPLPMAACAQTASHACAAEPGENTFAENLIRGMAKRMLLTVLKLLKEVFLTASSVRLW